MGRWSRFVKGRIAKPVKRNRVSAQTTPPPPEPTKPEPPVVERPSTLRFWERGRGIEEELEE